MTDLREHFRDMVQVKRVKHHPITYTYLYWTKYVRLPGPIGRMPEQAAKARAAGAIVTSDGYRIERIPYAVIAVYQPTPGSDYYIGVSRCSELDQFVRATGRHIAAGRAMKREKHTIDLPWTHRFQASGSGPMELAVALKELRTHKPCSYIQAANTLFAFCLQMGVPIVMYEGGE